MQGNVRHSAGGGAEDACCAAQVPHNDTMTDEKRMRLLRLVAGRVALLLRVIVPAEARQVPERWHSLGDAAGCCAWVQRPHGLAEFLNTLRLVETYKSGPRPRSAIFMRTAFSTNDLALYT